MTRSILCSAGVAGGPACNRMQPRRRPGWRQWLTATAAGDGRRDTQPPPSRRGRRRIMTSQRRRRRSQRISAGSRGPPCMEVRCARSSSLPEVAVRRGRAGCRGGGSAPSPRPARRRRSRSPGRPRRRSARRFDDGPHLRRVDAPHARVAELRRRVRRRPCSAALVLELGDHAVRGHLAVAVAGGGDLQLGAHHQGCSNWPSTPSRPGSRRGGAGRSPSRPNERDSMRGAPRARRPRAARRGSRPARAAGIVPRCRLHAAASTDRLARNTARRPLPRLWAPSGRPGGAGAPRPARRPSASAYRVVDRVPCARRTRAKAVLGPLTPARRSAPACSTSPPTGRRPFRSRA